MAKYINKLIFDSNNNSGRYSLISPPYNKFIDIYNSKMLSHYDRQFGYIDYILSAQFFFILLLTFSTLNMGLPPISCSKLGVRSLPVRVLVIWKTQPGYDTCLAF